MPILNVTADGTAITVGFPVGGLPEPGMLDVSVSSSGKNSGQDVKMDAFEYINPISKKKFRFFGCAPQQDSGGGRLSDLWLIVALLGVLISAGCRKRERI